MRVDPSVTCRPRREADNNITPAYQIYCPLFHDFVVVLFVVVAIVDMAITVIFAITMIVVVYVALVIQ